MDTTGAGVVPNPCRADATSAAIQKNLVDKTGYILYGTELIKLESQASELFKEKGRDQAGKGACDAAVREKMKQVEMPEDLMNRAINVGFSGGEKKRNEVLQLGISLEIVHTIDPLLLFAHVLLKNSLDSVLEHGCDLGRIDEQLSSLLCLWVAFFFA